MKCPNCGAEVTTECCPYCGSEMPHNDPQTVVINNYYVSQPQKERQASTKNTKYTSDKKKKTALLLCIFLGLFGVHNFYVGKTGKGILYLFTAGLFYFGWIIDIIAIATGSFTDCNGLPLDNTKLSAKEKRAWFLGFGIFGIIGVIAGISSGSIEAILIYLVWTGIFGFLYYRNKKNDVETQ